MRELAGLQKKITQLHVLEQECILLYILLNHCVVTISRI